jgi:peptidoglycan DL-endopeptidase CwlO
VRTPPSVRWIIKQRVAALSAVVVAAGVILGVTGSAGAASTPSLSQVEAKVKALQTKANQLGQQFDQVKQEEAATNQRLTLIDKQISLDSVRFAALRQQIANIAISDYEGGNLNSSMALLTSGNPQQILNKSSILGELSDANSAQIGDFLAATRQLTSAQALEQRTKTGILELRASLAKRKIAMNKVMTTETNLLSSLSPTEQAVLTPGAGGTKQATDPLPTTTQAEKAVAFAYAQLGCPYVYGGTGPCDDGFDCSGLTMEAWASAGVSIPRTSYEQWDDLTSVSEADVAPGDILVFLDGAHVGIYVGGGKLIDAPQTGEDVELVSFSGWYQTNLAGIVRP